VPYTPALYYHHSFAFSNVLPFDIRSLCQPTVFAA
jgi:hypothetical protein